MATNIPPDFNEALKAAGLIFSMAAPARIKTRREPANARKKKRIETDKKRILAGE